MRLVLLESPFAGDIEKNLTFARACLHDCFIRGEAPFASHLLYTQPGVLNDAIPEERERGIRAGFRWGENAKASVVYIDFGISRGMRAGIAEAKKRGRPVEFRMLSRNLFQEMLIGICGPDTAQDAAQWKSQWASGNPLYGHCAVATLLAQDIFGGMVLRVSLEGTEFAGMRSHYYNLLPDNTEHDFTREQFGGRYPEGLKAEPRTREYLLENENTAKRYRLLKTAFENHMSVQR